MSSTLMLREKLGRWTLAMDAGNRDRRWVNSTMTNNDDNASLPGPEVPIPEVPVEVFPDPIYAPYHTAVHH